MKLRGRVFFSVCLFLGLVLLLSAFAFSRPEAALSESDMDSDPFPASFQEFLWLENPVVLLVHVGLILVGALAVSALLPSEEEELDH